MLIKYIKMKCPCCFNKVVIPILKVYYEIKYLDYNTSKSTKFIHQPYYCNNCDIYLTSSAFSKELAKYILDQVLHIAEDYNVNNRLEIINMFSSKIESKNLMDFGGNSKVSFHQFLEKEGWKVDIDINDAINFKIKILCSIFY